MTLFSLSVPGCINVALVGNGFCNDETNHADCNYDGGECCVVNANTTHCSDCACHFLDTCAAGYHPLVGNEYMIHLYLVDEYQYSFFYIH